MVGLGKMGLGIARRLQRHGYRVTGFDPDSAARSRAKDAEIAVTDSLQSMVSGLVAPRMMWLMVPAGAPTDDVVQTVAPSITKGDLVIDGGNSNYRDSTRRAEQLAGKGVLFLDVGTSGGIAGEERGYCLMVGGPTDAVDRVADVFSALACDGRAGWAHVGPNGAGHFVKMIHNGVEYGMMQALAEGFALLEAKSEMDLDLAKISELWRHGSIVSSTLLDHVTAALSADSGLSDLGSEVADSGEGRWTVQEAVDLAVPAPVITLALLQRFGSRIDDAFANRLLSAMRLGFGGHKSKHT
jgi:6-phosphogluconate dehydrogenase